MWKTKIIFIVIYFLIMLFLGGLILNGQASQSYLPKADLIKGTAPEVYILENGVKRWIPDPEIFNQLGYKWSNLKIVSNRELAGYPRGDDLKKSSKYPDGTLLKGSGPEVYLIELGERRWIPSPRIFESNHLGWKYIITIDDKKLSRIKQGEDLKLVEESKYPDTFILKGPKENAVLEETEITFEFSGKNPFKWTSDLRFETFLEGYDKDWRSQSRSSKTYKLSGEAKVYTLYVRAKNKEGYVDPTPAKLTFQVGVSPYYQKVEIRKVRAEESNFEDDYLVLRNKEKELINVSDWTIDTGVDEIFIPEAISKLSHPFSKDNYSDIQLAYRDELIISLGLSPRGVNFRVNQCTGYFDNQDEFNPSLDQDCPDLDESEYAHLAKPCRDFIDKIKNCEIPDYSDEPMVNSDSQCTNFLNEKFNYKQCYLDHSLEIDFFESEWRVFLNKSIDILYPDETIILRDKNGLIVDKYSS